MFQFRCLRWKAMEFHKARRKDMDCQENLRTVPKLQAKFTHPGSLKQNVFVAIAIFDPSTLSTIKHYFPENADFAEFLDLVNTWWVISNSERKF